MSPDRVVDLPTDRSDYVHFRDHEDGAFSGGDDLSTYSDEWGRLWDVPGQRRPFPVVQPSLAFVADGGPSHVDGAAESDNDSASEYTLFGTPVVDERLYVDSMAEESDAIYLVADVEQLWLDNVVAFVYAESRSELLSVVSTTVSDGLESVRDFESESPGTNSELSLGGGD